MKKEPDYDELARKFLEKKILEIENEFLRLLTQGYKPLPATWPAPYKDYRILVDPNCTS